MTNASEIFKDKVVCTATGLVLAVLAVTGWIMFGSTVFGDKGSPGYTHMHCTDCEEEMPYSPKLAGTRCTSCDNGSLYMPTVGSIKDGGAVAGNVAKMAVFGLLALVLLQGLVYLTVLRSKTLHESQEKARHQMLICRCPYCRRKIGYPATKAGTGGICPRCKTAFVFASEQGNRLDSL